MFSDEHEIVELSFQGKSNYFFCCCCKCIQSFIESACPTQPSDKVTEHDGNLFYIYQEGAPLPADKEAAGEGDRTIATELRQILSPTAAGEVNSPTAQGDHFPHVHISQAAFDTSLPDNEGSTVDAPDCPFVSHPLQKALVKLEEQMEFALTAKPLERHEKIEEPESTAIQPCQPPPPKLEPAQLQTWCGPTLIPECEPVGIQAEIVKNHFSNGLHQNLIEERVSSDPLSLNRTVELTTLVETVIPAQEINTANIDYLSENANSIQGKIS